MKISGTGPNALDFHIAYYIGKLSVEEPGAFFHIVSRDKGFDPLIKHLKEHKILSARAESIAEIPFLKNGAPKPPAERAETFIASLKKPKATKPQTEKTMSSAIRAHFQPTIGESEVARILQAMVTTGFISIEAGKIVYAQSGPNQPLRWKTPHCARSGASQRRVRLDTSPTIHIAILHRRITC